MQGGYVIKSALEPEQADLEKINRYTRRPFQAQEVYTFKVALCDNEVDRDGERFSREALQGLSKLFLGKSGIFNHSMDATTQSARIYDTAVEVEPVRRTTCGEPYVRLTAKAYMPRTQSNRDLILEIDSGIKKEVSVGCSMGRAVCSVCGADRREKECGHVPGRQYGGKTCCTILEHPQDAYEWSFVAVPAQREAGVTKSWRSKPEPESWAHHWQEHLQTQTEKELAVACPGLPVEIVRKMTSCLLPEDLERAECYLRKAAGKVLPLQPQLAPTGNQDAAYDAFRI